MPFRRGLAALLLAATSLLAATPAGAGPIRVTDAAGRSVEISDTSRIVSIGGAVTETLFALGLGERVVAVDTTSTYPAAAEARPDVGYMRQLGAEGVLSARPSLILAAEGSGPPEAIAVLQAAGIPFVTVPNQPSAEGVAALIRSVSAAAGEPEKGEALAARTKAEIDAVAAALAAAPRPRVAFVMTPPRAAPLVAGRGTAADAMLQLAGATNVFADLAGYKPATPEASLVAAPAVIVTMARGAAPDPAMTAAIAADPALGGTPAAKTGAILSFDGSYLLGFGPRTAAALRDLASKLHPGLVLPEPVAGSDG